MTTDVWGKFTERVTSATGSKDNVYEFGAFSTWLDQKSKETVGAFTNNESDYQCGDIRKEVTRRVSAGEYTPEDYLLLS